MPSSDQIDDLIQAVQRDGYQTAMLLAINVVDAYLASSSDLDEFRAKWEPAKAVWDCVQGESVSDVARRIGRESAEQLRDALAIMEEHRP